MSIATAVEATELSMLDAINELLGLIAHAQAHSLDTIHGYREHLDAIAWSDPREEIDLRTE